MPTVTDFLTYSQWAGIVTLLLGVITGLAFVFSWPYRFRLVGATSFLGVLTAGLFSLSLVPFTRTVIPGAVRFSLVYDTGSTQVVITLPPKITESELTATLEQAASDLFSPGRLGRADEQLTIRARTVLHPEPGVSQPLLLGQVQRSLYVRDDNDLKITLFPENLAQLPQLSTDQMSHS